MSGPSKQAINKRPATAIVPKQAPELGARAPRESAIPDFLRALPQFQDAQRR